MRPLPVIAMRLVPLLLMLALPAVAAAQAVHLQGRFAPIRAPAADTRAPTGEARATIDEDGAVRVDLVVSGTTERATSATLHVGNAGENTEQVARMAVVAGDGEARVIGGRVELSPIVTQQIRAGDAYIVLRTSEHPDGYLRAQLAPAARTLGTTTPTP